MLMSEYVISKLAILFKIYQRISILKSEHSTRQMSKYMYVPGSGCLPGRTTGSSRQTSRSSFDLDSHRLTLKVKSSSVIKFFILTFSRNQPDSSVSSLWPTRILYRSPRSGPRFTWKQIVWLVRRIQKGFVVIIYVHFFIQNVEKNESQI